MNKIFILPSLFTVGNLCCGLFSLILTMNQQFSEAAWPILVAILFDMLDGRIARLTKTSSDFGKELDSLADLVAFGVAPSLLMYEMVLKPFHKVGVLIMMIYAICGALRLARFNIQSSAHKKLYFIGLPIPAAAGMLATFCLWIQEYECHRFILLSLPFFMLLLSSLMVSRVRYPCSLWIDLGQNHFINLVAIILGIGLIILYPLNALALLSISYLIIGGWWVKLAKKQEEIVIEPEIIEEPGLEKSH